MRLSPACWPVVAPPFSPFLVVEVAMPVCSYGGARCPAGPGAAGDAETVHLHEIRFHGKQPTARVKPRPSSYFRLSKEKHMDEADRFRMECMLKAKRSPGGNIRLSLYSAAVRARRNATCVANGG